MNDIHILDFMRIDTIKIFTLTTSLSDNQVYVHVIRGSKGFNNR
jgi:hypothetical protein